MTQPQPISRADANAGGANGQCPDGPYCSTRDGSPSGNGNGGGEAVGKPCAGCVGKADNKNPRGQMPNGSDHNAGYECDTNHGIARTNPAHTGCLTAPGECVPTPTVPCAPPPPCVPTETVPCVPPPCVPTETVPCGPSEGCVPTPTVPCVPPPCVPTETVPCGPSQGCVPTPTVPCVPTTPTTPGTSGVVSPVQVSAPSAATPAAAPGPRGSSGPAAGVLPSTGAPAFLAGITLAGFAALASGAALLVRRRRLLASPTG